MRDGGGPSLVGLMKVVSGGQATRRAGDDVTLVRTASLLPTGSRARRSNLVDEMLSDTVVHEISHTDTYACA